MTEIEKITRQRDLYEERYHRLLETHQNLLVHCAENDRTIDALVLQIEEMQDVINVTFGEQSP